MGRRTTPEIIRLCERAASDANKANSTVKDEYQRIRPFVTFEEPSLNPDNDASKGESYSYPSGHASRGYAFALALCTVAPEHTSDIMLRAQYYALNRVVCGHHWKSDIDASLLLASAMFANIVCTDEYQQQLVKAREEYKRVKEEQVSAGEGDAMRRKQLDKDPKAIEKIARERYFMKTDDEDIFVLSDDQSAAPQSNNETVE